jgi:transposase
LVVSSEEEGVVGVEQWAELRRLYFVERLGIKAISRQTGLGRNTVRRALRAEEPPRYRRVPAGSKLDPFREEVHRLLGLDPRLPGARIRELLAEQGYEGGKTILDDYLREVRPVFLPRPRTFQRTSYRPGELCQFDVWHPSRELPVDAGQTRRGYVVVGCLPYSRVGAAALVFSKEAPDLLWGISRCLWRLGALPKTLVWDREGALHAGGGRPTDAFASFCGQLRVGWLILEARDPQSKGAVERLQGFIETSFEPGRSFANELDYQEQLDRWFDERANVRFHRTLRCRPVDRLTEELAVMRPLPDPPDLDHRVVLRVPPDPYLRVDSNDYSLDAALVGRRVEARVSQREVTAVALDTGEVACRHRRSFARHRTINAPEHAVKLRCLRRPPGEVEVEQRPLARYDELIPA